MGILDDIVQKAAQRQRRVVFPEGEDERVIKAAYQLAERGVVQPVLLCNPARFDAARRKLHLPEPPFVIQDLAARLDTYAEAYYQLRAHKKISRLEARQTVSDPLYQGALMVRTAEADACVGGAVRTTSATVKAAIHCLAEKGATVSGFFLMVLHQPERVYLFADCGVVPFPNENQLVEITLASAASFRALTSRSPVAALLSFSTHGSAKDASIDQIQAATASIKQHAPDLAVDGDLQFDAALLPEIRARKAPDSPLVGPANTFIFPNLHAGNIAYKLTQRLAGATALGPILQGLRLPMNDLSRGCGVQDILLVAAISALQCREHNKTV